MNRYYFLILFILIASVVTCSNGNQEETETLVKINTDYGDIIVKLYNETPLHKENFIKLVEEGTLNDLLFHRVIQNFMIQGGDPLSKGAEPGKRLGGGSIGYTIPAEFLPEKYFHKRGALAAARTGGAANPEKRSSGSQFYIVQGEVFTAGKLDTLELVRNSQIKNAMFREYFENARDEFQVYRDNHDEDGFNIRITEMRAEIDSVFEYSDQKLTFSDEQRDIYTTIGGYPSLDGEYTIFGEVVEGMEVIDKIAEVETDQFDRPLVDIKMQVEIVN